MEIIAIPSAAPGGLDAGMSAHFGHCEAYTLVTLDEGIVKNVEAVPNTAHEAGGCLGPVEFLAMKGVRKLLACGMGMRPYMAFAQRGIAVYFAPGLATVGKAVDAYAAGKLPLFQMGSTCGGCGGHH